MNTNKKENEIDSFAKALLDSKNQGDPHPDTTTESKPSHPADAQQQLKKALDQLRKERGQAPIDKEERLYAGSRQPEEDFTTASLMLGNEDQSLDYLHQALDTGTHTTPRIPKDADKRHALPEIPNSLEQTATKLIQKGKHMKRKASQKISEVDRSFNMDTLNLDFTKDLEYTTTQPIKVDAVRKLDVETARKHRFKLRAVLVLIVLVLVAGLMVGYAYKTTIYDPQHTITPKMSNTYKKFVAYADEWDMSSVSEKNEILGYESRYNELLDSQKTDINAYFKEQTGKTLTTLFKELKANKIKNEEVKFAEISTYLSAWSSYDETQKAMVFDYLEPYSNLSAKHKKQLNKQTRELAGVNFKSFCELYRPTELKTDAQKIEDYTSELKTSEAQLETYKTYGEQLSEYANDPASYGFTSSGIQQEIKTNDTTIKQLNTKINSLKKKIKELS